MGIYLLSSPMGNGIGVKWLVDQDQKSRRLKSLSPHNLTVFTPDITVQLWSQFSSINLKPRVSRFVGGMGWGKRLLKYSLNSFLGVRWPNSWSKTEREEVNPFSLATGGRRWRVQLLHSINCLWLVLTFNMNVWLVVWTYFSHVSLYPKRRKSMLLYEKGW